MNAEERLAYDFDEPVDVLYLSRDVDCGPGHHFESLEGHLAQIDEDTGTLMGFTIFGWGSKKYPSGEIIVTVEALSLGSLALRPQEHKIEFELLAE
ncbi:MAG: hypothetical protein OXG37_00640 [Actinomycetia bacterium]|nr:hypothetical protein [Actinomycetes bacterium]